jgi:hypothetical protein
MRTYEPGTILAFSGSDLISQGIRWRTWSQWSHVGLIVDITTYDVESAIYYAGFDASRYDYVKDHPPGICLLESTTMLADTRCLVTGESISGVQCTLPDNRVANYRGRVASMRPIGPLDEWQRARLAALALSQCGTPYDGHGAALLGSVAWKYWRGPRMADRNTLWCTELGEMDLGKIGLGLPGCCLTPGYADPRKTVKYHTGFTHEAPKWCP